MTQKTKDKPISPEKKAMYAKNKAENERRKREERKREQQEGTTGQRRLAFLVDIYRSLGYTQKAFAEAVGMSQQLLNWYISVTDDCSISMLERMLAAIGLKVKLRVELPEKEAQSKSFDNTGVRSRIEGVFAGITATPTLPPYIQTCAPQSRLFFLRKTIEETGLPAAEFARKCEFDPALLKHYFVHDDMKVSKVYAIAKAMAAEIVWTINPLND